MLSEKWRPSVEIQPRDYKEALRQVGVETKPKILQKMQGIRSNALKLNGLSEVLQHPMRINATSPQPLKIISHYKGQISLKGTAAGG